LWRGSSYLLRGRLRRDRSSSLFIGGFPTPARGLLLFLRFIAFLEGELIAQEYHTKSEAARRQP
jgi:hypothetical protein